MIAVKMGVVGSSSAVRIAVSGRRKVVGWGEVRQMGELEVLFGDMVRVIE